MSQRRKTDLRSYYPRIAKRAGHRCEYCHAPESFFPHRLSVDHTVLKSAGGLSSLANLALCCYGCQFQKLAFESGLDPTTKTIFPLFHPRRQRWNRHFRWSDDGLQLEGLTHIGRATIARLALNNDRQIEARSRWKLHPDLFP
jgi:5-methylcytosine-specific restriction endonuclease McrA